MSYISIDIDLDDVLSSLNKFDRKILFEILQKDGYIPKECLIDETNGSIKLPDNLLKKINDFSNDSLNSALERLVDNSYKLTVEEENYIKKIAERVNP